MKPQANRLWEKGISVDQMIHRFTVGDDPVLDQRLVHWDCLGSAAHARTLHRVGLLSADELETLLKSLAEIDALSRQGRFEISPQLEDCHTAIEQYLTQSGGEAGKKIHAGRSRNDQVATAARLFMRHETFNWLHMLGELIETILDRMDRDGDVPMPGYTHLQPAMPSSVGQWLHAFAEALLEQMWAAFDLLDRLDVCPLGTGAGFGVPLRLDRKYTAALLGFTRIQRNPIDVQNSRGRMEKYFLRVAIDIGAAMEKLSWDMILFTTVEFGFFTLPESMTTGSSIMPQKKNADVLELLRAGSARLRAAGYELDCICGKLPSSYHRDLQLTKGPVIRTATDMADMLPITGRVIAGFGINHEALQAAMRPELYATHAAFAYTQQGIPFREAYRRVADEIRSGDFKGCPSEMVGVCPERIDAELRDELIDELRGLTKRADNDRARIHDAESALLPAGHGESDAS